MDNFNISQRYAKGLMSLVKKEEVPELLLGYSAFMKTMEIDNGKLFYTISGPQFSIEERKNILHYVFDCCDTIQILRNFFLLLLKKNRFLYCGQILHSIEEMHNSSSGKLKVTVTSYSVLKPNLRSSLCKIIEKTLSKSILPHFQIDPGMIGGISIKINDYVLDDSIKSKINKIKSFLVNVSVR